MQSSLKGSDLSLWNKKMYAVLLAFAMLTPVGMAFLTETTAAAGLDINGDAGDYPPTMVYGRVVDRFDAPVDMFVVVFSNVHANITNYTWGERGWYEYNLALVDITTGDTVELASSDGNCIYNYTFIYNGEAVRHDFVLHPEGPEPPGLPPSWEMDEFDDYNDSDYPDDFFDPEDVFLCTGKLHSRFSL